MRRGELDRFKRSGDKKTYLKVDPLDRVLRPKRVGELAQVGILDEDSPLGRPHLPGRPSSRVTVPATGPAVIAVEIEVDYIRVEVIQLGGERIAEIRKPRSRSLLTVNDTLHDV